MQEWLNLTLVRILDMPRDLGHGSAAPRCWDCGVGIPLGARISVSCGCCVLSGRGLCDGLITFPEEPYRVCVCVWERERERESEREGGRERERGRESLSVIMCSINTLHLKWVGRKRWDWEKKKQDYVGGSFFIPKCRYLPGRQHGVISQKTVVFSHRR